MVIRKYAFSQPKLFAQNKENKMNAKLQARIHYTEQARIATLEQQRDELAAALRDVVANERGVVHLFNSSGEASPAAFSLSCEKARAVLARIKA